MLCILATAPGPFPTTPNAIFRRCNAGAYLCVVFFFRERGVARELIQPRGNPIARTIIGSAMEFRRILLTGTHTQILSGHLTRLVHVYVQIMRYECRCFFVN